MQIALRMSVQNPCRVYCGVSILGARAVWLHLATGTITTRTEGLLWVVCVGARVAPPSDRNHNYHHIARRL